MFVRWTIAASSMDSWPDGNPVLAPILFEERPEHLINVFAVQPGRAAQDAFFDCAEFPESGVRAPVLHKHPRLQPPDPDLTERKGPDQTDGFEKDTGAARRRGQRAFPLGGLESRIHSTNLNQAD